MTKKILRYFSSIFLLFAAFTALAQPEGTVVEGVTAVVGKNIILKSEVELRHEEFKRQGAAAKEMTKCETFEEMLFEKLLIHHAEVDSVMVSDEEVESNIERRFQMIVEQMGGDSRKMEEYYGKSIFELKEEFRPIMREQLIVQRMQGNITNDVEATPTEVQEFFNSIPQDSLPLINTEVEVAQIVMFPEVSKEAEQDAREKLQGLKERIEGGSSFSSMAILYSEDPGSNKNGGEYKGIKRGQFVKEFEAVAFNLKKMEISDPFRTEYGYHIVQLLEKRGEEIDVRHILIKPKLEQEDLDEADAFLDSLRNMINSGLILWEDAAKEYSDDEATKFNGGVLSNLQTGDAKFELSQLDRYMFNALQGLKEGDISDPSFFRENDKEAFRLIKLKKRIEPHKANLRDDYQRIKGFAIQKKKSDALQEWINKKIKVTYIRINTDYFDCELDKRWLNSKNTNQ